MRPTLPAKPRLHGTLRQRRKADAARAAKQREDHSELVLRLKLLYELQTPESWRESLAEGLHSLTARCKVWEAPHWMPFRAVNWVLDTFWACLPIEKNPKVRCSLFRLGARMLTRSPFVYSWHRQNDDVAIGTMLEVLEHENLSRPESERAFGLLEDILLRSDEVNDVNCDRIARICLRVIAHHCTTAWHTDREMRRLAGCLRLGVIERFPSPLVSTLLADAHVLPYVFWGVCHAEGRLHRSLCALLTAVLESAPAADRMTLVVRHYPMLRETFHYIRSYDLVCFLVHPEFAGIVATTPSLLRRIAKRTCHNCFVHCRKSCYCKTRYDNYCKISVFVMESALDDDKRLQEILGYGFLSVAEHFATNRSDANTRRVNTFSRILSAHPEWRGRFKEMTSHGVEGNLTADLGRTIVVKKRLPGTYYILEGEDAVL